MFITATTSIGISERMEFGSFSSLSTGGMFAFPISKCSSFASAFLRAERRYRISQIRTTATPQSPGMRAAVVFVPRNMEARMFPDVSGVPGQQTAVVTPEKRVAGRRRLGISRS